MLVLMVALVGGSGLLAFNKVIGGDHTGLALAPLSVLPKVQKQGVGTALMKEAYNIAKK
ncbi:MAG: GNAT family N-acetyltransferase [Eubacteriales bacterium]